jgi:hypothetical protein
MTPVEGLPGQDGRKVVAVVDQSGLRHKEVRIVVPGGNIIFTIFSYVF